MLIPQLCPCHHVPSQQTKQRPGNSLHVVFHPRSCFTPNLPTREGNSGQFIQKKERVFVRSLDLLAASPSSPNNATTSIPSAKKTTTTTKIYNYGDESCSVTTLHLPTTTTTTTARTRNICQSIEQHPPQFPVVSAPRLPTIPNRTILLSALQTNLDRCQPTTNNRRQ